MRPTLAETLTQLRAERGILRWEEPRPMLPRARGIVDARNEMGGVWRDVADALRACPSKWAVIKEDSTGKAAESLAAAIRHGTLLDFRPVYDFDATCRTSAGRIVVYARYVGTGDRS